MNHIVDSTNDHDAIWLLIPWYANGRIDEQQRAHIDAHLRSCPACRDEVRMQQKICQAMASSNPDIEQLPTASLRNLWQKIDSQPQPVEVEMPAPAGRATVSSWRWPTALAASFAALLVATIAVVFVDRGKVADDKAADYYTVTSPAPRVPHEVIRAVFVPAVTVADMQRILDETQLHIVAGPTPAGVYSLAKTGAQSVDESLQQLRQHQEVLFAEPTASAAAQ
jgi:anti-sigma factor RsiW